MRTAHGATLHRYNERPPQWLKPPKSVSHVKAVKDYKIKREAEAAKTRPRLYVVDDNENASDYEREKAEFYADDLGIGPEQSSTGKLKATPFDPDKWKVIPPAIGCMATITSAAMSPGRAHHRPGASQR